MQIKIQKVKYVNKRKKERKKERKRIFEAVWATVINLVEQIWAFGSHGSVMITHTGRHLAVTIMQLNELTSPQTGLDSGLVSLYSFISGL